MGVLCASSCCTTEPVVPVSFYDCEIEFRKYGFGSFLIHACNWNPANITDATEWADAVAAGTVQCSPIGKLTLQQPTQTLVEVSCDLEVPVDIEYLLDWESFATKGDLSDYTYYKDLFKNAINLRLIPKSCTNEFFMCDEWVEAVGGTNTVAGSTPGFEFSVSQLPYIIEESGQVKWAMQFKIKTSGILCPTYLPGVEAELCC